MRRPIQRLLTLRPRVRVSRNVWSLGVTSLFTDISSEMVASALPAYLVLGLGLTPLAFGAIDGVYQGVGSIVGWVSGFAADRWRRHKEIALAGYVVSAACKVGLLVVSGWTAIAAVIAIDRMGKGLRTAPRDALISLSSRAPALGSAFGVHRTLDAAGALVGPMAAFGVLTLTPRAFNNVFIVSFSAALVGLGVLALFVENVRGPDDPVARDRPPIVAGLRRHPRFPRLIVCASALTLATVGDAFVYLQIQRSAHFGASVFPLLAFGTAGTYMLLAAWAGRLADRVGRARAFLLGHVMLFPLYALLWIAASGAYMIVFCVLLLGTYYALTDGVLAAAASSMLKSDVRATGLAVLGTAVSASRFASSLAFGGVWSAWGPRTAVATFAVALVVALPVASLVLAPVRET